MKTGLGWAPEIPDHWQVVPLTYVAKMGTGHTPDRSKPEYWEDCTIPWVTIRDATADPDSLAPLTDTRQKLSKLGLANSAAVVHLPGTVMLSRTASVGYSVLVDMPTATSQDFVTWSPGPRLNSHFLLLVLRAMKPEWERLAFGSTHRTIYMPDMEALRIPLPPIDEQRNIARSVEAETRLVDQLSAIRSRQCALLDSRMKVELASKSEVLHVDHGSVRVRHVITKIEQGWSPQCDDRPAEVDEWGVVKAGCVNGGHFDEMQHKALPAGVEPRLQYRIRPGDLLMSRASGSVELIGSTAVVPESLTRKLILCDKVYRIYVNKARVLADYVAYMLQTDQARSRIKLGVSGASGMANNLPTATVLDLPIPDVPLVDQKRVVADLKARRDILCEAKTSLEAQSSLLSERRQAIITAAVSGQLDVPSASGVAV